MQMAKRIFLFMATNILVVISLSFVLNLLGIRGYISQYGIDYGQLMAFCLVWGMGGAFISLAISRMIAKFSMGVQVVDPTTRSPVEQELVETVYRLARSAGLTTMPEVGIYRSPELNAFATGPTRNRSLVAVSTGLLERMNREELEGVLGHEIAHVANGDMVTMTLVQGVVNAFVMFLARVVAFAISQAMRRNDDEGPSPMAHYFIVMALEVVFMIFGTMVVAWFSRYREFRADQGGARLAGRDSMVRALDKLRRTYEIQDPEHDAQSVATLKISGRQSRFLRLFSTHPPLAERIERLEMMQSA